MIPQNTPLEIEKRKRPVDFVKDRTFSGVPVLRIPNLNCTLLGIIWVALIVIMPDGVFFLHSLK
jgi:hypothetical protein